jgi:hypothetical protein
MKKNLLVLCLSVGVSSLAQNPGEYVSNGISFKVGDTIQIGPVSSGSYYRYIRKHASDVGTEGVDYDLSSKKYTIHNVYVTSSSKVNAFYGENVRVISFGTKGFLGMTYYADIEEALRSGEIVLDLGKALRDSKKTIPAELITNRLVDGTAFLSFVKGLNTIAPAKFAEEYMYRYMSALYTRTHEDEFDYRKALLIAKNQLALGTERIDFSNDFNIAIQLTLKNYDFENEGFPTDVPDNAVYKVVKWNDKFSDIGVIFIDIKKLQFVEVPEDKAKQLLEKMKDSNGAINREVFAKVNFKVTHSEDKSSKNDNRLLIGEITSFELYGADMNLIGTYSF